MFYNLSQDEIEKKLNTNSQTGLSKLQVGELYAKFGANTLIAEKSPSIIVRFLSQFKDFMVIVLIVAAIVSFIVSGHAVDSIVILLVVFVNAILGTMQENKAEKSLQALKKMAAPHAKVLRDGERDVIEATELVVGDIIFIDAGDLIPADARIIDCGNLKVIESALTGESLPVEKQEAVISGENIPLGDRKNMLYSSTIATYGRATAIVTAIGMDSECGKIAGALSAEKEELTPIQKRLAQIGTYLGILAIVICGAIFGIGMLNGTPFVEIFMTAVTLAVAAIPEGLPAIVTVVLAMGVQRLVKRNAIIRKLPAVETLGSTSVVCSDKTGTLTKNQMTVVKLFFGGKLFEPKEDAQAAKKLLQMAVLCCDGAVEKEQDGTITHIGDPTETAMVAAFLELGIEKETIDAQYPRLEEIPFDSQRKLMTTLHKENGKIFCITKGAPDELMNICSEVDKVAVTKANKDMADKALRVLAVAVKELAEMPDEISSETLECDLHFVGLIGMIDPPREEAKEAVAVCKTAGITPVMITGDHKDTAVAIARSIGILYEDTQKAITGAELDAMTDEQLVNDIENLRVYARVSPENKIRIVKAWKSKGQVVAMTGDGVNDAPALKAADIGCAMGITGTEVSKGAADMILTDDNFATITAAVEEGRGIYQNIKKCISFLLSSNLGEVITVFSAMVVGIGTPLMPTQILWVNLVTDSLPALALGVEPVEKDIMERPPISSSAGFFTKQSVAKIFGMGIMVATLTLTAYCLGLFVLDGKSMEVAQTMAFLTLALGQLVHAFNMKTDYSLFRYGIKGSLINNKYLCWAFLTGLALQLLIYFVPFLASVFGIVALTGVQAICVIALSLAPVLIMEVYKAIAKLMEKNI